MKVSTLLGSVVLCVLEVYASPMDSALSPVHLDARGTEYCCVSIQYHDHTSHRYVPFTGGMTTIAEYGNDCRLVAAQSANSLPSQRGCPDWMFSLWTCYPGYQNPVTSVQDAKACQDNPW
ncbi:hypothetical protein E4U43_005673 [Claviceps pusilla]|uniref:Uncharacterized protein n=1 Tax=Claviceps pusilla TaxID=123648 RepID=A0A9P7ST72_9HYPO|nr:hypothetical protein E4U43_005673 [Claviceps pusilla]